MQANNTAIIQNGQGILNYNYSYGSNTCYMFSGEEYSSIGAVMNYSMIPGTTSYLETDKELYLKYEKGYNKEWGGKILPENTNCDGLVDNDRNAGIMITDICNDAIKGSNTFISYRGTLYVLGVLMANNEKNDGKMIVTTIDQCLADSDENLCMLLEKDQSYQNAHFIYKNLCDSQLTVQKHIQTGSYSRNSSSGSSNKEIKNVFLCYFDWGNCYGGITYSYSVTAIDNENNNEIVNIVNTNECHLIEYNDGTIIASVLNEFDYINQNGEHIYFKEGIYIK